MYRVKMLDGIKEYKLALVNTHECAIYSKSTQSLSHFASTMYVIGVTYTPLEHFNSIQFSLLTKTRALKGQQENCT